MTAPDLTRLRAELLEQQRQALDAALRERAEHPQGGLGLPGGWLAIVAALESAQQALDRMEREARP